jgi:hypothetical protein
MGEEYVKGKSVAKHEIGNEDQKVNKEFMRHVSTFSKLFGYCKHRGRRNLLIGHYGHRYKDCVLMVMVITGPKIKISERVRGASKRND